VAVGFQASGFSFFSLMPETSHWLIALRAP
jgi:hypothetical protein